MLFKCQKSNQYQYHTRSSVVGSASTSSRIQQHYSIVGLVSLKTHRPGEIHQRALWAYSKDHNIIITPSLLSSSKFSFTFAVIIQFTCYCNLSVKLKASSKGSTQHSDRSPSSSSSHSWHPTLGEHTRSLHRDKDSGIRITIHSGNNGHYRK